MDSKGDVIDRASAAREALEHSQPSAAALLVEMADEIKRLRPLAEAVDVWSGSLDGAAADVVLLTAFDRFDEAIAS